ncbi:MULTISPECIES: sulfotransferase family 2 domain-containing protein [unclassified Cyanobium]|uniref:sulfotransferase family 2 domain-containing protein n=1 Tax=unclassified Cyanobium TaxID=2627006 RepID=UPI0020CDB2C9|nr:MULTISPECIES: sulfotransferase family 2 domain-containing protein [unclassified Cyanobium]MCP9834388.1 sulfotransferase family 2 domain-containing protein [Cyanobium sp. La Preciosa 7G6]MCP9937240.1 sulfotransferase family 2 domain-containing protein [Cyanobium sp. Aljojuca 7A6]
MAIISRSKRFIFISNGKTGTTSIEDQFGPFADLLGLNGGLTGLWANKHIPPAILRSLLPREIWDSCFKFVFVRHPLDWFTSQYTYNLTPRARLPQAAGRPRRLRRLLHRLEQGRAVATAPRLQAVLGSGAPAARRRYTVEDVNHLHEYLRRYRGLAMAPTLLQTSYVCDADGKVIVDFIGRFETLEADCHSVSSRLGLAITLPHMNRTDHLPPSQAFEPEAEARIRELWAVDFATLGYD